MKSYNHEKTRAELHEKWKPMTKQLSEVEAVFTAHVLEEEARYLNDVMKDIADPPPHILKFTFPLLRRVAPAYASGGMPEFEPLIHHLREEMLLITDAILMSPRGGTLDDDLPNPETMERAYPGMAERIQQSIKSFKDVPA